MTKCTKWFWAFISTVSLAAQAQIDLTKLDRDMVGPTAQLLVLGTVHLRELPEGFNPASLQGVLARLGAYKPDIITIEAMSGEECDLVARHPEKYAPPDIGRWCRSTNAAKAATGLDIPAALAEVDKTLKAWPAQSTPTLRRHLASLFLAAGDTASAYVQWLQLPEAERHAGDGLDAALVEMLGRIGTHNNEDYQLAARLAAQLGLQRVYAVDNHTGDYLDVVDDKALWRALDAAWKAGYAGWNERARQTEVLSQATDLLPLYRFINGPEYLQTHAEVNVGAPMRAKSPERYPQMWVAGWEIRNLRMVANIRETFRERPGARVLSIVGVGHKPWFDGWLGQLQGVTIVDAEEVLK